MILEAIKSIGERHALLVPDRTRFNPVRAYVEEVVELLEARLAAVEEELKRRKGGRPKGSDNA